MAPRTNKILHDEQTRAKIQAAQIINRFMDCVNGKVELSSAQVSAGKTLLNKVLPDLSAVSVDGEMKHDASDPLKELMERIATNGKRIHGDG